jgi:hypothetical protein
MLPTLRHSIAPALLTSAIAVAGTAPLLQAQPVHWDWARTYDLGSRNYNIDLSQQRANSVVEQLVASDIEQERMVSIGLGKNAPVADNRTEAGRSLNRRVEFRMAVDMEDHARELKR